MPKRSFCPLLFSLSASGKEATDSNTCVLGQIIDTRKNEGRVSEEEKQCKLVWTCTILWNYLHPTKSLKETNPNFTKTNCLLSFTCPGHVLGRVRCPEFCPDTVILPT
jgi:hypothetical protein